MKKKIIKKFLALVLALLLIFNPTAATFILAEEEPTPTTSVDSEQVPESIIATGDAEAQAEVATTANANLETVAGEITVPEGNCTPPEGQTTCPSDIVIGNDNQAEVADVATSLATTGDSQITGSPGDVTITTSDATASGTIDNEINSNIVILETPPEPTVTPEVTPSEDSGQVQGEEKTLTVENKNEGTVANKADILASTGGNLAAENLGDAKIETGNALALANLLTLLNTNIVGSDFEILLLNLLENSGEEVNLNEIWKQIQEGNGGETLMLVGEATSALQILIKNQNQADLENKVNVVAGTGENQTNENNNVEIETGDATALANVVNVVNTNIVGAKFFLGIINILGPITGNIILPRPEMFAPQLSSQNGREGIIFENQNQAEITDQISALAETGQNEENNNLGNSLITTGDATAKANNISVVNLNIWRNNWFFLLINNLGNWEGNISGWTDPAAEEEPSGGSQVLETGLTVGADESQPQNLTAGIDINNQNQAIVRNNIQTTASTGENLLSENRGETSIETGKARSLANLFNLVNLNILGGRFFMGLVNILGDWSGNAVFAYPDVTVETIGNAVEVTPGQTIEYALRYKNQGNDEAKDVWLRFTLPAGMEFVSDSSGLISEVSGKERSWFLGDLGVGEEGDFTIVARVDPNFSFEEELTFWSKIIPQVRAAENEKESRITVLAAIGTTDPESDSTNNSSSVATLVYLPTESETTSEDAGGIDQKQPKLEITAKNNVNGFVYPGDTVTFEVTVKNTGEAPSYHTRFVQKLYNGVPGDIGAVEIDLGTIEPGKGGTLTFGTILADGEPIDAGNYHTISQAIGHAPNDNEVRSNEARTDFSIRTKAISELLAARAVDEEGEALGSATAADCPKNNNLLPYVLLFLLSSYCLVTQVKPRLQRFVNK